MGRVRQKPGTQATTLHKPNKSINNGNQNKYYAWIISTKIFSVYCRC